VDKLTAMQIDDPGSHVQLSSLRAQIAEHQGDLGAAHESLIAGLQIAKEAGLRNTESEVHMMIRDLAKKRNDFEGYIRHNDEYQHISEEVRGKQATQKIAMMEAERTMEAERRERDKEKALLYGALPESVATRMLRGERVSGDHFEHAAVMFADVVGFTSHTADMNPADVVMLLDTIFASFDALCEQHGLIKVKTIGDSYMCFKGDAPAEENARAVAQVALHATAAQFTWPNGEPLSLRFGLHLGPATAGVIGTQRLQYDVWGDTVNVASRLESTGEPNRIHISEHFKQSLTLLRLGEGTGESSFVLTLRGEIEVKGKGLMKTFWLSDGSRTSPSPPSP